MKEKIDELYQEYLNEKLDLVFQEDSKETVENKFEQVITIDKVPKQNLNRNKMSSDGYTLVKKNGTYVYEYNINSGEYLNNGEIIVFKFVDGYAIVQSKKTYQYNIVDINRRLISKEWFYDIKRFKNGYALVKRNNRYNFIDKAGNLVIKNKNWYEEVWDFVDGYALVKDYNKFNFIDTKGNLISEKWFYQAHNFKNGYAIVKEKNKSNFIDTNGNFISKVWYEEVWDFEDGYALVEYNYRFNFIDTNGNLISNVWYEKASSFSEGYAVIKQNGKWNFIDIEGKLISDEWYEDAWGFYEGYALIRKGTWYNLIDTEGKLISDEWYEKIGKFCDGYALVKNKNKYNFIDKQGNLFSEKWYDYASDFVNGYAKIGINDKYNAIDVNGNLILNQWLSKDYLHSYFKISMNGIEYRLLECFGNGNSIVLSEDNKYGFMYKNGFVIDSFEDIGLFNNNCAWVKKGDKYNFINTFGELLSEKWYDYVWEFCEGYALVKQGNKYNFIDTEGNLISKEWYDNAWNFNNGFAIVRNGKKYNFINKTGNLLSNEWYDKIFYNTNGHIKVKLNGKIYMLSSQTLGTKAFLYEEYQVNKTLAGYVCKNENDTFKIKYNPVLNFNYRYILCSDKNNFYLYDRISDEYELLGLCSNISFCKNNLILNNLTKRIYLICDNQKLDLTSYYNKKLRKRKNIPKNVNDILLKEEFCILNTEKIDQIMEELREERRKVTKKRTIDEEQEELKKIEEEEKKLKKEQQQRKENARKKVEIKLMELKNSLDELAKLSSEKVKIGRITIDNIFIQVANHLEINPIICSMLKYIDLSYTKFDNVKMNGIDFSDCNINFNPQKVYNKDLSNCNFEGVHISPFLNFSDVDIRGTSFSNDNDSTTIDTLNMTFKNAIYDETTTYNGIPLTEIIDKKKNQK